ncbi:hypothetical protein CGRA01v4_08482 [Colletotrichum graminicola]|uniref:Uncharacterized protein n=1 Tax=Colletotrichum graminicola (strain M1.001 / M2 / FGSC 10212) TaxID=645133 RepID=E3QJN0_COLGM|nr:uncharacterized protein GLRG_06212 [Colletotrichum graminicola M1.001]EFQ31068.1 hypothetical protein GLRG_06212 [Colletotrichum graminicola M1.001]WDK17199.1 hypothetical protein CGRA01v4_08482 [Colletotrichum graminicola]
MAPEHGQAIGKVAYNVWLDAFDDGLRSAEPRPQKTRLVASEFVERQWLKTRGEIIKDWNRRHDSWHLPTTHETALENWGTDHHCFWIGWFVPRLHRNYEDRSPKPGQCVNSCSAMVLTQFTVNKAFKVVYKAGGTSKNKLFALYCPDTNGVCKAISVPGGVCSVLFFEEWRDDTLTARTARQRSWLRNVMSSSLAEPSSLTPEASSELQPNERGRQIFHEESSLSDSVVEDRLSSCNDSDGDGSEYVFSGSESSESGDNTDTSHTSESLKTSDDGAEEGEEQIDRKPIVTGPMQRDAPPHTSFIVSTRNTVLDTRSPAKARVTKVPEAKIGSISNLSLSRWESLFWRAGVTGRDDLEGRSETCPKGRATPAHAKISGTQTKKRRIRQHGELDSRPKRSRPSRQASTALVKAKNGDIDDEDEVKVENTHDSDDEVQFIREVSLTTNRKKQPMTASAAPSMTDSAAFVLDFIATDKLAKVARLHDAVSRRVTLKAFRKHLTSTVEADSDALAHNIAENEDEDTRIMLAEALAADLAEKMAVIAKPHSDGTW